MAEYLIVYGTSYGHTARIVNHVAALIQQEGHQVTIWRADVPPDPVALGGFRAVIVAGSVTFGKHQRYLRNFVRRYAPLLNTVPSMFLSVCGAAASGTPAGRQEAQEYIARFLRDTGWQPAQAVPVAGAVAYSRYNPLLRLVMRRISAKAGRPTDTSRDWEFTDWESLDRQVTRMIRGAGRGAVLAGS